jgi:hypothetical protein
MRLRPHWDVTLPSLGIFVFDVSVPQFCMCTEIFIFIDFTSSRIHTVYVSLYCFIYSGWYCRTLPYRSVICHYYQNVL